MSELMTWNMFGDKNVVLSKINLLRDALDRNDTAMIIEAFNTLLSTITYGDYEKAKAYDGMHRLGNVSFGEWLYRAALVAYLVGARVHVHQETQGSLGQSDIVIEHAGRVWVMELKVAKTTADVERQADAAMAQIHEKGYARQFRNPTLLGIAIDDGRRWIGGYRLNDKPFRAVDAS